MCILLYSCIRVLLQRSYDIGRNGTNFEDRRETKIIKMVNGYIITRVRRRHHASILDRRRSALCNNILRGGYNIIIRVTISRCIGVRMGTTLLITRLYKYRCVLYYIRMLRMSKMMPRRIYHPITIIIIEMR